MIDEPVGHPTPEEAARGDIPEAFTQVVWCAQRDDHAVVLLQVSMQPEYFDLAYCGRGPWGWVADVSGGGSGTERPDDLQVLHWLSNGSFENY